jgi:hypothetical protein
MKVKDLAKDDIGKFCVVQWYDTRIDIDETLDKVVQEGLIHIFSSGWIRYFDETRIILSHSFSPDHNKQDLLTIPVSWISTINIITDKTP